MTAVTALVTIPGISPVRNSPDTPIQTVELPVGGAGGIVWEVYVTDDPQVVTSVLSTCVSCLTGEKFTLCYACKFAKERKLLDKLKLDVQLV